MRRPASAYLWKWWYGPAVRRVWRALEGLPACVASREGRVDSLRHEGVVIERLIQRLGHRAVMVPVGTRSWFDVAYRFRGQDYYFNIKVSRGGVDNALNKQALVYTFSGLDVDRIPRRMTYNRMWRLIRPGPALAQQPSRQQQQRQYYYIYVDKADGTVFVRGLRDIRYWVANAANGLQIHWGREKLRRRPPWGWASDSRDRVLDCLRQSLRRYWQDCEEFVDARPEPAQMKT